MLYLAALALVGLACAPAFRWPAMLICSALAGLATFALALRSGQHALGGAVLRALEAAAVLQVAYVVGGFAVGLRLRGHRNKRDIEA